MPAGVYEHKKRKPFTEEHRKHMSESQKGKRHSVETKIKMSLARKGFIVSEETKEKLREANIGKKHTKKSLLKMSGAHKGERNHFYGKHHTEESKEKISKNRRGIYHTEETKKKISEALKKSDFKGYWLGKKFKQEHKNKISKATKGANNPRWNGGIEKVKDKRNTIEYREWRLMVFGRDNFTCQDCGKRGTYLEAHHIKKWKYYPQLRFKVSNGITLCKICHKKLHITLLEEV